MPDICLVSVTCIFTGVSNEKQILAAVRYLLPESLK